MMARKKCDVVTLGAVVLLVLGSAGCLATHKYVQTQAQSHCKGTSRRWTRRWMRKVLNLISA